MQGAAAQFTLQPQYTENPQNICASHTWLQVPSLSKGYFNHILVTSDAFLLCVCVTQEVHKVLRIQFRG